MLRTEQDAHSVRAVKPTAGKGALQWVKATVSETMHST
jgi:hypothetical protein